jgi:hypothetical protein
MAYPTAKADQPRFLQLGHTKIDCGCQVQGSKITPRIPVKKIGNLIFRLADGQEITGNEVEGTCCFPVQQDFLFLLQPGDHLGMGEGFGILKGPIQGI